MEVDSRLIEKEKKQTKAI